MGRPSLMCCRVAREKGRPRLADRVASIRNILHLYCGSFPSSGRFQLHDGTAASGVYFLAYARVASCGRCLSTAVCGGSSRAFVVLHCLVPRPVVVLCIKDALDSVLFLKPSSTFFSCAIVEYVGRCSAS